MEVSVLGYALKYADKKGVDVHIYTDLKQAVCWANGEWNAVSKRVQDYVHYLTKLRNRINVEITTGIPEENALAIEQIKQAMAERGEHMPTPTDNPFRKPKKAVQAVQTIQAEPEITLDKFSIVIYRANGSIYGKLTEWDFCNKLQYAVDTANWYDNESKDPKSMFYGCRVERFNVPLTMPERTEPTAEQMKLF
jgi:hypothetical protein